MTDCELTVADRLRRECEERWVCFDGPPRAFFEKHVNTGLEWRWVYRTYGYRAYGAGEDVEMQLARLLLADLKKIGEGAWGLVWRRRPVMDTELEDGLSMGERQENESALREGLLPKHRPKVKPVTRITCRLAWFGNEPAANAGDVPSYYGEGALVPFIEL
jgi:hypothetical protein